MPIELILLRTSYQEQTFLHFKISGVIATSDRINEHIMDQKNSELQFLKRSIQLKADLTDKRGAKRTVVFVFLQTIIKYERI